MGKKKGNNRRGEVSWGGVWIISGGSREKLIASRGIIRHRKGESRWGFWLVWRTRENSGGGTRGWKKKGKRLRGLHDCAAGGGKARNWHSEQFVSCLAGIGQVGGKGGTFSTTQRQSEKGTGAATKRGGGFRCLKGTGRRYRRLDDGAGSSH